MANNAHIIAWSREGMEALVPIQEYEEASVEMVLEAVKTGKAPKCKLGQIVFFLTMRARFNSQRVFEVYAFDMSDDYTTETFEEQFNENPQPYVDWLRKNGVKIYSDYNHSKPTVIS